MIYRRSVPHVRELASVRAHVVCCAGGPTYVRELASVRVVLGTLARESFALSLRYRSTYCKSLGMLGLAREPHVRAIHNNWDLGTLAREPHICAIHIIGKRTPSSRTPYSLWQSWQENHDPDPRAIYSMDYGELFGKCWQRQE